MIQKKFISQVKTRLEKRAEEKFQIEDLTFLTLID
jgi:hypothetical protein